MDNGSGSIKAECEQSENNPAESTGIGRGVAESLINDAWTELKEVPVLERYQLHKDLPIVWEVLEHRDIAQQVAHAWVKVCPHHMPRPSGLTHLGH